MSTKIVYCIPSLYIPGGMERVLTLKANYLAEQSGYEVFIILTDGGTKKPYYELSPNIHMINLDVNYDELFGKSLIKRVYSYVIKQYLFKKKLSKTLHRIHPDITISLLRREINFLMSIRDGSLKIGELHVSKENYRDLEREKVSGFVKKIIAKCWMHQLINNLKRLDCFVVLTHEDREKWTELNNVKAIHNPLSFFPEKASDCSNHQVIAVGRYVPQKGFDLLINSWNIVSKKHPNWVLRIYGDGEMRDVMERQIQSLGLGNTCFLEHTVTDIDSKYCESSIFVLSSRYEGFGMVICEAMACGIPTVSFACPCGPKDIINNGEDGILIENGNIEQLAHEIDYLIENDDIRKKMGLRARINVERFKTTKIMSQWEELFVSLLKSKPQ